MIPFIVTAHGKPEKLAAQSRARPEAVYFDCRACKFARDGTVIHLPPIPRHLFIACAANGGYVNRSALIDAIYADDKNGGPSDGSNSVSSQQTRANRILAAFGLRLFYFSSMGITLLDLRGKITLASAA